MINRIVSSLSIALLLPCVFWVGGFSFDHRGEDSAILLGLTLFIFVAGFTYPRFTE